MASSPPNDISIKTKKKASYVWSGTVRITQHEKIAKDTYHIRLECPTIASSAVPGQFVMMRLPGRESPLLGRPLALHDTVRHGGEATASEIDIVYIALGRMTRILSNFQPGDSIEVWGPLGNGFPPCQVPNLVLVSGGIGYTPFLAVTKEALKRCSYGRTSRETRVEKVVLCHGVRSSEYLPDLTPFSLAGAEVLISSEDGTVGQRGLVTEMLPEVLDRYQPNSACVFCCGPEAMMRVVAEMCALRGVPCFVSLETPMACGMGICFSCVARLRETNDANSEAWDFHRVCVEGPVFDASRVLFD